MLSKEALTPLSGGPARQLVVILHGLGADGRDVIDLGQAWQQALPDAAFVAPNAPEESDMSPFGRQWFSLMDRRPAVMAAAASAATAGLARFIDAELAALNLRADALALVGFSQGMMMAFQTGLTWPQPLAAILGYSGALLPDPTRSAARVGDTPILLVQGEDDDLILPAMHEVAAAELRRLGGDPETLLLPELGHSIDQRGLDAGERFLRQAFKLV